MPARLRSSAQRHSVPRRGHLRAERLYRASGAQTKDIDVFCKPGDYPRILHLFQEPAITPEIEDERWIAKVRKGEDFFDVIFNSTAGVTPVNDLWFTEERKAEIFGHTVRILPPTEFVWSKAFVQNRDALRRRRHRACHAEGAREHRLAAAAHLHGAVPGKCCSSTS